jgi:hypothetical protein
MRKEELAFLVSFIENIWQTIRRIKGNLQCKRKIKTYEDAVVVGYLLHNLYSPIEDILKEISRIFENRVDDLARHHAELLKRMSLDIPGIRPKFISNKSFKLLNELR